jgi:cytochrome c-type biogenesis protein
MSSVEFVGTVAFALSAGVATFFAPCAYPLLPGYVGYYVNQQDEYTIGNALLSGLAAAAGVVVAFAMVGAVVFTIGQQLVSSITLLEPVVGVALVVLGGLMLMGNAPSVHVSLPGRPTSRFGFGVFGAVYGIAAAGCVIPVFLGVISQALSLPLVQALVAFGAYTAGVAVPLVAVTLLLGTGLELWQDSYPSMSIASIQTAAAVLLVLAGLAQIYVSIVVLDVFGWF